MANINKKFVKTVQQLCENALATHDFVFDAPKQISLLLNRDDLSGKQRKAVKAYARLP